MKGRESDDEAKAAGRPVRGGHFSALRSDDGVLPDCGIWRISGFGHGFRAGPGQPSGEGRRADFLDVGLFHGGARAFHPAGFHAADGAVSAQLAAGAHARLPDFAGGAGRKRVFLRAVAGREEALCTAVCRAEHQRVLGGLCADDHHRRVLCTARGADQPVRGTDGPADDGTEERQAAGHPGAAVHVVRADGGFFHSIPVLRDDSRCCGGRMGVSFPCWGRERAERRAGSNRFSADADRFCIQR